MADFSFSGVEDLIKALDQNGLFDEDTQQSMLYEAGDIFSKEVKTNAQTAGHIGPDDAISHIGYQKKIKKNKNGSRFISVTASGANKYKQKFATILFVLNYGRRKTQTQGEIQPSYFWTRARQTAEPKIHQKWTEMVTEKLKQKGLI